MLSADFFQNDFFLKIFQEHFGFVGPDLGPNGLQWSSADNKSRHWQGKS